MFFELAMPPHLDSRLPTQIIWNSAWEICLFSSIYLFSHLVLSVWTLGFLFYTLFYNPVFFFSNSCSFDHWKIFQFAYVSISYAPMILFFFFSHFQTFGITRCSRLISSPKIRHFSDCAMGTLINKSNTCLFYSCMRVML